MKHAVNPTQQGLFDPEMTKFSPVAFRVLSTGWQGVFRKSLLERMPTEEMGQAFSETMGRPTKELYSMAGLVVIAQMKGWTSEEEAAQAYMFDLSVQYALNLGHHAVEVTSRTVERYQRLFREKELAQRVFDEVTQTLVRNLEIEVDQQRLDSTHVFGNMASLSRTQLMLACIRRFLVQLKRRTTLIAWLNPMPQSRWASTSAQFIARLVPHMFQMDRDGFGNAIDALRGQRPRARR